MNKVILMGRLTADPEIRNTTDGKAVASYTLAVDRRVARGATGQTADFIRCVAWEKRAEFAEKYLHKGAKIVIAGRIQTGSYTKTDGTKVYTTDVVVEEQEFAESKGVETQNDQEPKETPPPAENAGIQEGFVLIPDGLDDMDLPFN